MDAFVDNLWSQIVIVVQRIVILLDLVFSPLDKFGPLFSITVLAGLTVVVAKLLSRKITTKRYQTLQSEFRHWHSLREEAMKNENREKGKLLAKNIDQAKLNKVYYDYFFEGLLLSLVTKYLPFMCMLAYVNESYSPAKLAAKFGRDHLFKIGDQAVGSIFWFVLAVIGINVVWMVVKKFVLKPSPSK